MKRLDQSPMWGYDMPTQERVSLLGVFTPAIRRYVRLPDVPHLELAYAPPQCGDIGLLTAVWCERLGTGVTAALRWRCGRWPVAQGEGLALAPTSEMPVWLYRALVQFIAEMEGEGL